METERVVSYGSPQVLQYEEIEPEEPPKSYIESFEKELFLYENPTLSIHGQDKVIRLCKQPYYNHEKPGDKSIGCPNFGVKETCPPFAKNVTEQYDLSTIQLLTVKFPMRKYVNLLREIHPEPSWTNRALVNQRFWQAHLKSILRNYWNHISYKYPEYNRIDNPEAQGINVEESLIATGLPFEWCIQDKKDNWKIVYIPEYAFQVNFIGKEV